MHLNDIKSKLLTCVDKRLLALDVILAEARHVLSKLKQIFCQSDFPVDQIQMSISGTQATLTGVAQLTDGHAADTGIIFFQKNDHLYVDFQMIPQKGMFVSNLSEIIQVIGGSKLENELPHGLIAIGDTVLHEISIQFNLSTQTFDKIGMKLESLHSWPVQHLNDLSFKQIHYDLSLIQFENNTPNAITGTINASMLLNNQQIDLQCNLSQTAVFQGTLLESSIKDPIAIMGITLPPEFPDIFAPINVSISPDTGEITLNGEGHATWSIGQEDYFMDSVCTLQKNAEGNTTACFQFSGDQAAQLSKDIFLQQSDVMYQLNQEQWTISGQATIRMFDISFPCTISNQTPRDPNICFQRNDSSFTEIAFLQDKIHVQISGFKMCLHTPISSASSQPSNEDLILQLLNIKGKLVLDENHGYVEGISFHPSEPVVHYLSSSQNLSADLFFDDILLSLALDPDQPTENVPLWNMSQLISFSVQEMPDSLKQLLIRVIGSTFMTNVESVKMIDQKTTQSHARRIEINDVPLNSLIHIIQTYYTNEEQGETVKSMSGDYTFYSKIQEIQLYAIQNHILPQISLPDILPDLVFKNLDLRVIPATQAFTIKGAVTTQWMFGDTALPIHSELSIYRTLKNAIERVDMIITIDSKHSMSIADNCTLTAISLKFSLEQERDWYISGAAKIRLWDRPFDLFVKHTPGRSNSTFIMSSFDKSYIDLITIPNIASLQMKECRLQIAPIDSQHQHYKFIFNAPATFHLNNILTCHGTILMDQTYTKNESLCFIPESNAMPYTVKLFSHADMKLLLHHVMIQPQKPLSNEGTSHHDWMFFSHTTLSMSGFPNLIMNVFPDSIPATLTIDHNQIQLEAHSHDYRPVFTLPDMPTRFGNPYQPGSITIQFNKMHMQLTQLKTCYVLFQLLLPKSIQGILGLHENGDAVLKGSDTTNQSNSVPIQIKLDLSENKTLFTVQTFPFQHGTQQQTTDQDEWYIHLNQGDIKCKAPIVCQFDPHTGGLTSSITLSLSDGFKLPLFPIKNWLSQSNIALLADMLPDQLPLTDLDIRDISQSNGMPYLMALFQQEPFHSDTLQKAIQIITEHENLLPLSLVQFFRYQFPKSIHFDMSLSSDLSLSIQMTNSDPQAPFRFLIPGLWHQLPVIHGITMDIFSIQTKPFLNAMVCECDVQVDQFDIYGLSAAIEFNQSNHEIDSLSLQRQLSASKLHVAYWYDTKQLIPIAFEKMQLNYQGIDDIGLSCKISMPAPQQVDDLTALMAAVHPLETQPLYDKIQNLNFSLSCQLSDFWIKLPKKFGQSTLGSKGLFFQTHDKKCIAHLLDAIMHLNINSLMGIIPLQNRSGYVPLSIGSMQFPAKWMTSTQALQSQTKGSILWDHITDFDSYQTGNKDNPLGTTDSFFTKLQGIYQLEAAQFDNQFILYPHGPEGFCLSYGIKGHIQPHLHMKICGDIKPDYQQLSETIDKHTIQKKQHIPSTNYALIFDGKKDYIDLGVVMGIEDSFTFEVWLYCQTKGGEVILHRGGEEGLIDISFNDWYVLRMDDHTLHCFRYNGLRVEKWVHLAGTYDGSQMRLYIDGDMIRNYGAKGKPGHSKNEIIMGKRDQGDFFKGLMTDIRIWDHALEAKDIQARMYETLKGDEAGLILYLPLKESLSSPLRDETGHYLIGINGPRWQPIHIHDDSSKPPIQYQGEVTLNAYDHCIFTGNAQFGQQIFIAGTMDLFPTVPNYCLSGQVEGYLNQKSLSMNGALSCSIPEFVLSDCQLSLDTNGIQLNGKWKNRPIQLIYESSPPFETQIAHQLFYWQTSVFRTKARLALLKKCVHMEKDQLIKDYQSQRLRCHALIQKLSDEIIACRQSIQSLYQKNEYIHQCMKELPWEDIFWKIDILQDHFNDIETERMRLSKRIIDLENRMITFISISNRLNQYCSDIQQDKIDHDPRIKQLTQELEQRNNRMDQISRMLAHQQLLRLFGLTQVTLCDIQTESMIIIDPNMGVDIFGSISNSDSTEHFSITDFTASHAPGFVYYPTHLYVMGTVNCFGIIYDSDIVVTESAFECRIMGNYFQLFDSIITIRGQKPFIPNKVDFHFILHTGKKCLRHFLLSESRSYLVIEKSAVELRLEQAELQIEKLKQMAQKAKEDLLMVEKWVAEDQKDHTILIKTIEDKIKTLDTQDQEEESSLPRSAISTQEDLFDMTLSKRNHTLHVLMEIESERMIMQKKLKQMIQDIHNRETWFMTCPWYNKLWGYLVLNDDMINRIQQYQMIQTDSLTLDEAGLFAAIDAVKANDQLSRLQDDQGQREKHKLMQNGLRDYRQKTKRACHALTKDLEKCNQRFKAHTNQEDPRITAFSNRVFTANQAVQTALSDCEHIKHHLQTLTELCDIGLENRLHIESISGVSDFDDATQGRVQLTICTKWDDAQKDIKIMFDCNSPKSTISQWIHELNTHIFQFKM